MSEVTWSELAKIAEQWGDSITWDGAPMNLAERLRKKARAEAKAARAQPTTVDKPEPLRLLIENFTAEIRNDALEEAAKYLEKQWPSSSSAAHAADKIRDLKTPVSQ